MGMIREELYLFQLTQKLNSILGQNLIGLYQTGSGGFENYIAGKSDLDIAGVVTDEIDKSTKDHIALEIDHAHFPCPAAGLDLILLREAVCREVHQETSYEFWFSTGANWPYEAWEEGYSQEILIVIESCRRNAISLFGESPSTYFSEVKKQYLLQAFMEMLSWHQSKILDPYHDPMGVNSVLNAARVLAFVETNELMSKSDGGKWILRNKSWTGLVGDALKIREEKMFLKLQREGIIDFLRYVIEELKRGMTKLEM